MRMKTVCKKCAEKRGLLKEFGQANIRMLAGQGPDSVCDLCGQENGGAVMDVPNKSTILNDGGK